jgi:hypothetical protein
MVKVGIIILSAVGNRTLCTPRPLEFFFTGFIVGQMNFRPQRQFAHKNDPTIGDLLGRYRRLYLFPCKSASSSPASYPGAGLDEADF